MKQCLNEMNLGGKLFTPTAGMRREGILNDAKVNKLQGYGKFKVTAKPPSGAL